jgi:hypothetical protein
MTWQSPMRNADYFPPKHGILLLYQERLAGGLTWFGSLSAFRTLGNRHTSLLKAWTSGGAFRSPLGLSLLFGLPPLILWHSPLPDSSSVNVTQTPSEVSISRAITVIVFPSSLTFTEAPQNYPDFTPFQHYVCTKPRSSVTRP